MPVDSRRLFAPETVLSPALLKKAAQPLILVNEGKLRHDGRQLDELRPMLLNIGVVPQAKGSAYFEVGNTKIISSVYGPREVFRRKDFRIKGQLYCEFKYAAYSCKTHQSHIPNSEEKDISNSIREALESVVLLHKFPKSRVDIFILVLENDGAAISSALTCAGAALADAGVEMYDLAIGCSLRQFGTSTLIDPDAEEEVLHEENEMVQGRVALGLMPSYNQVILLVQDGVLPISTVSESVKLLTKNCEKLYMFVKDTQLKYLKKKENEIKGNCSSQQSNETLN